MWLQQTCERCLTRHLQTSFTGLGSNLVPILPFAGESVHQGVYAVVGGPQFESAAEVRMLRMFGADIVGK